MATCPRCRTTFGDGANVCPHDGVALLPDQAFASEDGVLAPGTQAGEYRIEEVIAEGGFGTVYRGVHPVIGKSAAIKVLKREFSVNPEMVSRFIAEARAVNQIRHKNIVDIFAFGTLEDKRHFYVMELLEGTTLDRLVHKRGKLDPFEALPIIKQLGRALGAAHAAGITHRDIKPENVFLVYDDEGVATAKLLDFGIAKLIDTSQATQVTRPGAPMGTPLYMSPEQVYGRGVDSRSDIYSFGILIHEVLTGAPPFDGETVMDVLTAQTTQKPRSLSSVNPALPAALDAPILQMLEKDPDKRPGSITVAIDRLMEAAAVGGLVPRNSRPSGPQQHRITPATPLDAPADGKPTERLEYGGKASLNPSVASTMASVEGRATPEPGVRPKPKGLVYAGIAAVALGIGAVAILATRLPSADHLANASQSTAQPGAQSAAPAPTVDPVAPASAAPSAATVAPLSSTVRLGFDGVPPDADVIVGGKPIGKTGTGVDVPRGTEKLKVTVKKSGFLPKEVWIMPDRDRTVTTDLSKPSTSPGPGPRGPAAGSSGAGSPDLEF